LELTITLENPEDRVGLFGAADANLRLLREAFDVHITARDGRVQLTGKKDSVRKAATLLDRMQKHLKRSRHVNISDMGRFIQEISSGMGRSDNDNEVEVYGRSIVARTEGQQSYIEAIQKNDMVFCVGPAGTGKTYLAVANAVAMLKRNVIRRLILARPAVEAGEKLGFLPGDMQAKVNPYLRPLFDALGDMMDYTQVKKFMYNDLIEVVPLAFMRGRTLNGAVVILDEAQNTTVSQMMMFLTRLGHDSKMIITGDDSQSDLEDESKSGLRDALRRLGGIKGIKFIRLTERDIVRHRLVQNIVKAYGNIKST